MNSEFSWKRGLIGLAILAVFIPLMIASCDTIDPASGATTHHHSALIPPHDPGPKVWGKLMAYNQNHGKLGNSVGRYLPHKIVHRLNTYKSKHPRVPVWWNGAIGTAECMWNGDIFPGPVITDVAFCLKYGQDPKIHAINKTIIKIKLGCEAGMVVGAFSGGEFGIVAGTAVGCAWAGTAQAFLDTPWFIHATPHPVSSGNFSTNGAHQ